MTYQMLVGSGKIREFARATRSDHPAYLARPGAVVTPTFLTTAQFLWAEGDGGSPLDLDLTRVLHAEEEFAFPGSPPSAGQTLTVATRLGERYEKEGVRGGRLRFVVLITEYHDEAGVLVAEQRTTLVETGHAVDAATP